MVMRHAVRILTEERWWLSRARRNAETELLNPHVPAGMALAVLRQLDGEIEDVEDALRCLAEYEPAAVPEALQLELWA